MLNLYGFSLKSSFLSVMLITGVPSSRLEKKRTITLYVQASRVVWLGVKLQEETLLEDD